MVKRWMKAGYTALDNLLLSVGRWVFHHPTDVALAMLVGFGLVSILGVVVDNRSSRPTLETRIEHLSAALTSASRTISDIEEEVQARQALVMRLQRDARTAEQLAQANRAQVEAVAQVLRREMDRDQTWAFWIDIAKNAFFAMFGAVVGLGLGEWRQKRARQVPEQASRAGTAD